MSFLTGPAWNTIGVRHHHGICLPVASIFTASSCGIGEYLDLCPLIKYVSTTGFDTIQLLPIQDTGDDPSPYMGRSGFALHPIYLSLRALPGISAIPGLRPILASLSSLNALPRVSYHEVLQKKLCAISLYLDHHLKHIEEDPEFALFMKNQKSWLPAYSLFISLRSLHNNRPWWEWKGSRHDHNNPVISNAVRRCQATQFLCFQQMREVKRVADSHKILLQGDVPILMNKDSADVWWHPELFSFRYVVGAPPDMYNAEGQKWGFPPFAWRAHEQDGFFWWRQRLKFVEQLFHMFRLDHVVGFFRLWAIGQKRLAKTGHFIPQDASSWQKQGEKILTALVSSTSMLPIGEDLGNIPDLVRASMQSLGIPGLKVLRWERAWHADGAFLHPAHFSPESLTTVSTHDSSTLSGWWEESAADSQRLAACYGLPWSPKMHPDLLFGILSASHQSGSLFHVNLLQEYLAMFSDLSWGDFSFDRINVPGTLSPANWTFRTKKPLEEILEHRTLLSTLRSLF